MAGRKRSKLPRSAFGWRLAGLVGDHRLADFARELGISVQSLYDYMDGTEPKLSIIQSILDYTGVNPDWLLSGLPPVFGRTILSKEAREYVKKEWEEADASRQSPYNKVVRFEGITEQAEGLLRQSQADLLRPGGETAVSNVNIEPGRPAFTTSAVEKERQVVGVAAASPPGEQLARISISAGATGDQIDLSDNTLMAKLCERIRARIDPALKAEGLRLEHIDALASVVSAELPAMAIALAEKAGEKTAAKLAGVTARLAAGSQGSTEVLQGIRDLLARLVAAIEKMS